MGNWSKKVMENGKLGGLHSSWIFFVAKFADELGEHLNGATLVKYLVIFTPAWYIWSDIREIMSSCYNDDLMQRVLILWIMALLVLYGNNATLVGDDIGALRTTLGAFMTALFTTMVAYLVLSTAGFQHRPQVRILSVLIFASLLIWIPLLFECVSIRAKIAVAVVAIAWQDASRVFVFGPWIKRRLNLEYSITVDINHEIDRLAAFFIIVLGEYLYTIIAGNPAAVGLNSGLLKAVWTLVIAFCMNWLYINGDGSIESSHALRRSVFASFVWIGIHLPLSAALLAGGHVCAIAVGSEELEKGKRWLMGGGLGVGMLCLFIFGLLFDSKDPPQKLMFPKLVRMTPRLIAALILALLWLSNPESLRPVSLLSTEMAVIGFAVLWETGGLERGASIYEKWVVKEVSPSGEPALEAEKVS